MPNALEPWVEKALNENYQVRIAQANFDIAALEVDRQRAGHYPTVDLVASFNQTYAGGAASATAAAVVASDSRLGMIGVQLDVPIYQGGLVNSRVHPGDRQPGRRPPEPRGGAARRAVARADIRSPASPTASPR